MIGSNSHFDFVLRRLTGLLTLIALLVAPLSISADSKKKSKKASAQEQTKDVKLADVSNIVWPQPPAIARVKYASFYAGEKFQLEETSTGKKKQGWMDRLAGSQTDEEKREVKPHFFLIGPYGLAVDSKGRLYVADEKVGAIFIFNTETRDVEMIKNGSQARFARIIGLAIDDGDRLFVSDSQLHRVLVFNPKHEVIGQIEQDLANPAGLAVDNENRLLYVADVSRDQVLVFDADTLKPIRKIGTTGKNHELTTPGDFAKPVGVAVDSEGNLYVADTLNNRIESFDADGQFIGTFGKSGDGPGYFARPKGIAIDADNHIWVTDGMQDRVQVFNEEGQLLTYMGGHGNLPGQFAALCGIAIDKQNRVFTSEQYPGRVQQFRYVTEAEAAAERTRREEELGKRVRTSRKADEAPATKQEPDAKAKDSAPR